MCTYSKGHKPPTGTRIELEIYCMLICHHSISTFYNALNAEFSFVQLFSDRFSLFVRYTIEKKGFVMDTVEQNKMVT